MKNEIEKFLSVHRLAPYYLNNESFETAFARYQLNIKLAEACLPSLNYIEIGLRNGLNNVISEFYGDNWLLNLPYNLGLTLEDKNKINEAKNYYSKQKRNNPTQGDIIANLNFGFWVSFFHKRYNPGLWYRKGDPLKKLFPNMDSSIRNQKTISDRLFKIKELRNRIAHHEPIWNLNPSTKERHQLIWSMIYAMSPEAAEALNEINRLHSDVK